MDICPISLKDVRAMILIKKANCCLLPKINMEQQAIESCNTALNILPRNVEALKVRAKAYRTSNDIEQAKDDEEAVNELEGNTDVPTEIITEQPPNASQAKSIGACFINGLTHP